MTPFLTYGGNAIPSKENVNLFEKYDFGKGNYAIVGLKWHDQRHELQKEMGNFYTDDIKVLLELKQKWITEEPSPMFACGYHFGIFVVKDGKELTSFFINVEEGCNTVGTECGHFFFDPNKIREFKNKFKRPICRNITFDTLQDGRNCVESLHKNDDLLLFLKPEWIEYDGEFRFEVECNHGVHNRDLIRKCLDRVKDQVSRNYPGQKFSLTDSGWSEGKILIKMNSSKTLYDLFELYEINWEWMEYAPSLRVILKKQNILNSVIKRLTSPCIE